MSAEEILQQIDFLVSRRFEGKTVPSKQFKIQFARMGEPALNPQVLTVLKDLPRRYCAPGLMPSISTVAPRGSSHFFQRLLELKREHYPAGRFQLQFSLHTTDIKQRERIIPVKTWSFQEIAEYGERFHRPGDRKITLNFALAQNASVDPSVMSRHFSPEKFLIKITPLNPTYRAQENHLSTYIDPSRSLSDGGIPATLRQARYDVIVSIGEVEENRIGSNCGQYLKRHAAARTLATEAYTYDVQVHASDGVDSEIQNRPTW